MSACGNCGEPTEGLPGSRIRHCAHCDLYVTAEGMELAPWQGRLRAAMEAAGSIPRTVAELERRIHRRPGETPNARAELLVELCERHRQLVGAPPPTPTLPIARVEPEVEAYRSRADPPRFEAHFRTRRGLDGEGRSRSTQRFNGFGAVALTSALGAATGIAVGVPLVFLGGLVGAGVGMVGMVGAAFLPMGYTVQAVRREDDAAVLEVLTTRGRVHLPRERSWVGLRNLPGSDFPGEVWLFGPGFEEPLMTTPPGDAPREVVLALEHAFGLTLCERTAEELSLG